MNILFLSVDFYLVIILTRLIQQNSSAFFFFHFGTTWDHYIGLSLMGSCILK